jgi:hypothetical protein
MQFGGNAYGVIAYAGELLRRLTRHIIGRPRDLDLRDTETRECVEVDAHYRELDLRPSEELELVVLSVSMRELDLLEVSTGVLPER